MLCVIDGEGFHRLEESAPHHFGYRFGLGYLELVPLAAQGLYQDSQVQLAPACYQEDIGAIGILHLQCDIGFQLSIEPLPQLAGGAEASLSTCKRRGVDPQGHLYSRLTYFDAW